MYAIAQRQVAWERPETLVGAIDPVNFEKPYTQQLEGVSTVHKSTPPAVDGQARLTKGYPAITATVTNLTVPVITDATQARLAYEQWRLRPTIERPYRFEQEQGLDKETQDARTKTSRAEIERDRAKGTGNTGSQT